MATLYILYVSKLRKYEIYCQLNAQRQRQKFHLVFLSCFLFDKRLMSIVNTKNTQQYR